MSHSILAAVDLGSNSFRLQVSRVVHGQPYTLDALKETVRLAAGLDDERNLDVASQNRALACLKRFGERLRGIPPEAIRVVGTNTLRVARNVEPFLEQARVLLGVPIEIIAGQEEARLIYVGVSQGLQNLEGRCLVVDIGGGSTEIIIGSGAQPTVLDSLYMGCVSYSQRFFESGRVTADAFQAAELAAQAELQRAVRQFAPAGWDYAVGSSGTARALADLLSAAGMASDGITRTGLEFLRERLLASRDPARFSAEFGLRPDRVPVLPGGLAIMLAIFKGLGIDQMQTTEAGLREGVLYEMLGRFERRDIRDETVKVFALRYQVDPLQALRVEKLALSLYRQSAPPALFKQYASYLAWAARLHEIGLSIAHGGYHRHSAYIIDNADMPGFSKLDQGIIGGLAHSHRGRLSRVSDRINGPEGWRLVLCLRLAALFHRGRIDTPVPRLRLMEDEQGFVLQLGARWLSRNSLVHANLETEAGHWAQVGLSLRWVTSSPSGDPGNLR